MIRTRFTKFFVGVAMATLLLAKVSPALSQEVKVLSSLDQVIEWLKKEDWWGEEKRGKQLQVPHTLITGISTRWQKAAQNVTVPVKKELFYRFILPLVVHANEMVLDRRATLIRMADTLSKDGKLAAEDLDWLRRSATLLRIDDKDAFENADSKSTELRSLIDLALHRLDVIPAGLALGQAAYESGYGTSRFAAQGNALFGQWTFGGEGLKPEQQRSHLGDHRIASYDWPFDSIRAYFINLSSHPAYEEFRRIRADLKAAGKPLSSLALADGLINYSERGQAYVDTLKSIIRVNNLNIADNAVFRSEELSFIVGADDEADAKKIRQEIVDLRRSGELAKIIKRMRLE